MNTSTLVVLLIDQTYGTEWFMGALIQTLAVAGFAFGVVAMIWAGFKVGLQPPPQKRRTRRRR